MLATIYLQKRDYRTARLNLEHILSIDPDNYTAHCDLAVLAAMQQPWFLALNAAIEMKPVMVPADPQKAGPAIADAVKTYG